MNSDLRSLPSDVVELLAAERRAPSPSAAEMDRLLGGIQARLASVAASGGGPSAATAAAPRTPVAATGTAAVATKPLLVALAVAAAVGAAAGARWLRGGSPGSPRAAGAGTPAVSTPAAAGAATPPPRVAVPSEGPSTPAVGLVAAMASERTHAGSLSSRPRPIPPSPSSRDLAAESALLDKACLALARSDTQAAFRALARHRREFGDGALVEEREALQVKTLAQAGDLDGARREARRFERRFPGSVQLQSIADAVGPYPQGGAR